MKNCTKLLMLSILSGALFPVYMHAALNSPSGQEALGNLEHSQSRLVTYNLQVATLTSQIKDLRYRGSRGMFTKTDRARLAALKAELADVRTKQSALAAYHQAAFANVAGRKVNSEQGARNSSYLAGGTRTTTRR